MRIRTVILILILLLLVVIVALAVMRPPSSKKDADIVWGLTFSPRFSEYLELDWKKVYQAMLDDLNPPLLRIPFYWDDIEEAEGVFNFEKYDYMMYEADRRDIRITPVLGIRVPRWPECHIPKWAAGLTTSEQRERVLGVIRESILRYKHLKTIEMWQVENEPFLSQFGICPPLNPDDLDKEIALVRVLDPERRILVTDSGELSKWTDAAKRGDVFGTTMYFIVWSNFWSDYLGYIDYRLPVQFFWLKANIVHLLYGADKRIIIAELQSEPWLPWGPWGPGFLKRLSFEEQDQSLSIAQFYHNIEFARDVGFPEVYLWGVEWWYSMKVNYDRPEFWSAAKGVFDGSARPAIPDPRAEQ
jgi:hypothetical protein